MKRKLSMVLMAIVSITMISCNGSNETKIMKEQEKETSVQKLKKETSPQKLKTDTSPPIAMAALESEQNTNRPIVFVHGATMGSWDFEEYFMPYFFEKGYNVYALNLRGHGDSGLNKDFNKVSLADFIQDVRHVVEFVEKRNQKEAILAGHSMGGAITQAYMKQYEVKTAIFLGMADFSNVMSSIVQFYITRFPEGKKKVEAGDVSWFTSDKAFVRAFMFGDETNPKIDTWVDSMIKQGAPAVAVGEITTQYKVGEAKGNPKVFIATGKQDPAAPENLVKSGVEAYNADNIVIDDMYHGVPTSANWQKAAEAIYNWLSSNS